MCTQTVSMSEWELLLSQSLRMQRPGRMRGEGGRGSPTQQQVAAKAKSQDFKFTQKKKKHFSQHHPEGRRSTPWSCRPTPMSSLLRSRGCWRVSTPPPAPPEDTEDRDGQTGVGTTPPPPSPAEGTGQDRIGHPPRRRMVASNTSD